MILQELAFILLYGLLLFIAAYYDVKYRKVPDAVSAAMWMAFVLFGFAVHYAVAAFAGLFMLNVLNMKIIGRPFLGWADILVLPIFIDSMYLLNPHLAIAAAVFAILINVLSAVIKRTDNLPLMPYLFGSYFCLLIVSTLSI